MLQKHEILLKQQYTKTKRITEVWCSLTKKNLFIHTILEVVFKERV